MCVCVYDVSNTSSVTVSHVPGGMQGDAWAGMMEMLRELGEVEVTEDVAVVTVVGRR